MYVHYNVLEKLQKNVFLLGFLIVATYAALAILSLTAGYWAGVGSSLPLTRSEFSSTAPQEKTTEESKESAEGDSESESDDEALGMEELSAVKASMQEECKLVSLGRGLLEARTNRLSFPTRSL